MTTEPKPMDPEKLSAWRDLTWRTHVPGEQWRIRRSPGRVDVIAMRDGVETEVLAANVESEAKAAMLAFGPSDLAELLDDRDACAQGWADALNENSRRSHEHYEAMKKAVETMARQQEEIQRLRSRVRVEAEDATGVTSSMVEAWLARHGWARIDDGVGDTASVWRHEWPKGSPSIVAVDTVAKASEFAEIINRLAKLHRKCGLDILDEMARMETTNE